MAARRIYSYLDLSWPFSQIEVLQCCFRCKNWLTVRRRKGGASIQSKCCRPMQNRVLVLSKLNWSIHALVV